MSEITRAYWWVNHKQTFQQEFEGGYLWSPKKSATGATNRFYDNMRRAKPGDSVVSYADGRIRALGEVTDTATTAPKPATFRTVGSKWSDWGWLLPVQWQRVNAEPRPADHLAELLPVLPEKYSPLNTSTGKGNQNAYLSEIDSGLMSLVKSWTNGTTDAVQPSCDSAALLELIEEKECGEIDRNPALSQSEREALVLARKGQGVFRERVIALHGSCVVSGIGDPRLLRASHIKPWRLCETSTERLDPQNGLLLAPNLDQMFDRGLISFNDDGSLIVSSTLADVDRGAMGLHLVQRSRISLAPHLRYIEYHRASVLIP
ncbi:HNH endonuclease [Mitsuaria sp. CC2]|uniref:HNH endonuclease n=1 Tax=Mitsuaria sp. CC2 TaxID=3029186 RepID=UPI003B8C98CC